MHKVEAVALDNPVIGAFSYAGRIARPCTAKQTALIRRETLATEAALPGPNCRITTVRTSRGLVEVSGSAWKAQAGKSAYRQSSIFGARKAASWVEVISGVSRCRDVELGVNRI